MKTYKECIQLPTFEERYSYLRLAGRVGNTTFGDERFLNQTLYHLAEWKIARRDAIARDLGCDLAVADRSINTKIYVHHINPITIEDVLNREAKVFDLNNLICTSFDTHQAIHYGDENMLIPSKPLERRPNDQAPWRKEV